MTKKQEFHALFEQDQPVQNKAFFRPILMQFAANYIGKNYGEFASDYKVLVEANLKCMEDFDTDAVGLISDPYRETAAFGATIKYHKDAVPQCMDTLVSTVDDIERLKNPDVHKSPRTLDRIKAAESLSKTIGNEVPIIGWVEGPMAEACDLAGINETLLNLMMDPDLVKKLIDKVMITTKDFAKAQIDAGCDVIGVGDAICSQIATENYQEFVKEKHQELFEFIQSQGAKAKLHICGDITHLLPDISEVRPDIVDIDHMVNMDKAHELLGPDIVRSGNLNPVSAIQDGKPESIEEQVKKLCEKEKGRKFILSGGCEITVKTPIENLEAMRKASVN